MRQVVLCAAMMAIVCGGTAWGCLWDQDTLAMERERFPGTLELISGKFLRHSPEFYAWRIEDRLAKLAVNPGSLSDLDDLAVAYDKTGEHAKAIELMQQAEALSPGRYETEANLGTFYIHSGQFEQGLEHIGKAIAINPEAHFGREVYQKLLVEYVLSKQVRGQTVLPLCGLEDERYGGISYEGFAAFVLTKQDAWGDEGKSAAQVKASLKVQDEELAKARKGVLGMMRFGNFDSPILLEALGDLLIYGREEDGKRLACRAYLKASQEVESEEVAERYRELAESAIQGQSGENLSAIEMRLQTEVAAGNLWYDDLRTNELKWIAEGGDVDAAFAQVYYVDPSAVAYKPSQGWRALSLAHGMQMVLAVIVGVPLLVVLVVVAFLVRRRRRVQRLIEG